MPMLLTVVTAVLALAGIVLGALTVRTWNPDNDPEYFRDVVHQGVVAFLKLGLLLLLVTTAAVAVVGSIAALRGDAAIPRGVWVSAVAAWVLAVGFVVTYLRQRAHR